MDSRWRWRVEKSQLILPTLTLKLPQVIFSMILHVVFTNIFWNVKATVPKTHMIWYISWIHPQVFQSMYTSSWLQCLQLENYEMHEQFNSFMQCVKQSATQMSQKHFFICNYLLINGIQGKSKSINVDWKFHCLVLSKVDVLLALFVSG